MADSQDRQSGSFGDRGGLSFPPCIYDLCLQLLHAGETSVEDRVRALPRCIGCGACANRCPNSGLRIEERGRERLILISGTVIARMEMEECKGCGLYYVPVALLRHVDNLVQAPQDVFYRELCPQCKRIAQAARIVGGRADFGQIM